MPPLKINITDNMKRHAMIYENAVIAWIQSRGEDKNYTGLYRDHRYYFGAIGEYVLGSLLKARGKSFSYKQTVGSADSGDFDVDWADGQKKKLDVKTATESFHSRIMMPKAQASIHSYDFYIGVRLVGDVGEIWGYSTLDKFKLNQQGFGVSGVSTLYRPLSELESIEWLLGMIDDKSSIE